MKIVERLLNHPDFRAAVDTIEKNEATRIFCRHGLDHALDVARITWMLALENNRPFDKESIYLAALLHDLGRSVDNANHDEESMRLAARLLPECGANSERTETIIAAIGVHREKRATIDLKTASFGELLAYADHKSRPCYRCAAAANCYWDATAKNHTITY
jgi:uncharacterized protein